VTDDPGLHSVINSSNSKDIKKKNTPDYLINVITVRKKLLDFFLPETVSNGEEEENFPISNLFLLLLSWNKENFHG
jgi:hypothetical protein